MVQEAGADSVTPIEKGLTSHMNGKSCSNNDAYDLVERIVSIHDQLGNLSSLIPSPEANGAFEALVGICTQVLPDDVVKR